MVVQLFYVLDYYFCQANPYKHKSPPYLLERNMLVIVEEKPRCQSWEVTFDWHSIFRNPHSKGLYQLDTHGFHPEPSLYAECKVGPQISPPRRAVYPPFPAQTPSFISFVAWRSDIHPIQLSFFIPEKAVIMSLAFRSINDIITLCKTHRSVLFTWGVFNKF